MTFKLLLIKEEYSELLRMIGIEKKRMVWIIDHRRHAEE
jgi:hypothetical protein